MKLDRRQLLGGSALAAAGALTALDPRGDRAVAQHAAAGHGMKGHGGGANGATMRKGQTVDHSANGFNPSEILRDFDEGTTRRLASGRALREWEVVGTDKEIEVAPGIKYPAWTFNGRVPGPSLRAREGERLRIRFVNGSAHPHTMHFHGIHPAEMDGVPQVGPGVIEPGKSFVYEFDAEPFGMHLYHCHVGPLAEHIARGMYGAFIVDPKQGREDADELVMMMNGFNTNFDAEGNQVYAVNSIAFHYVNEPIRVKRGELVRIYLANILEYDPINSFHLHGNFFEFFPTGTRLQPADFTDTIGMVQGQRGILEVRFPHEG
ncbi:MAG: multicopper oxidase domain-containing protein, partial [Thermomicrobiales bacterium]